MSYSYNLRNTDYYSLSNGVALTWTAFSCQEADFSLQAAQIHMYSHICT